MQELTEASQTEQPALSKMDFSVLYDLYATDVLRVCYYYLGNRQQAEDVTQEVFVKYLTARPALLEGKEKAWLLKVALNKCRDLWRGSWHKRIILGHPAFELFPAPEETDHIVEEQSLSEAVHRLPGEFKEVVLLFYYQGYGVTEIAEILHIAEGTVSSRLSRARSRLKADLKGNE